MALIKCGNCGTEVSNIGKCPKCGALICQECGHVLDKKEVKCPNCGKGTKYLSGKVLSGWINLCVGLLIFLCKGGEDNSTEAVRLDSGLIMIKMFAFIVAIACFFVGLYRIVKYGRIKYFS